MALLRVFRQGQFLSEHQLEPAREFLVGRGESCDVILAAEAGISRQHFRLRYLEGKWVVEVLSRYGELYKDGAKKTIFSLKNGATFSAPPFEFVFDEADVAPAVGAEPEASYSEDSSSAADKTQIAVLQSAAFLKIKDHTGRLLQTLQLDGDAWVAGRDTGCSIFLDDVKVSRRQFELQKIDEQYFIRDQATMNSTQLNSRRISLTEWTPLSSGDVIQAATLTLVFELRDRTFDQRLQEVDPSYLSPVVLQDSYSEPQASQDSLGSEGFQYQYDDPYASDSRESGTAATKGAFNPVRILILLIVVGVAGYYFLGDQMGSPDVTKSPQAKTEFDRLSPEKQEIVRQTYLRVENFFQRGQYQNSLDELTKMKTIISHYERSREYEEGCTHALETLQVKQRTEEEQREREETEAKIRAQVKECRLKWTPGKDLNWLESCLSSVSQFNPDHEEMKALRNFVQVQMDQEAFKGSQRKEYLSKVSQLRELFEKAKTVEKKGFPLPAIAAYTKVFKSKLPDPQGLKAQAQRQVASLQTELDQRQERAEKKAEEEIRAGRLKEAILTLRDGIKINPDNEVLKGRHQQVMADLRKNMQTFYQEAILEESVGEVETAKAKWKKIVDQSLPGEDYYEKARLKLKKYGSF